jgi:hypothetical protein
LHEIRSANEVEVVGLLTTVTEPFDRASMHGVRCKNLQSQAAAGLPLTVVIVPSPCLNGAYEADMVLAKDMARGDGTKTVALGDLLLEDICTYREPNLAKVNMVAMISPQQKPTGSSRGDGYGCPPCHRCLH